MLAKIEAEKAQLVEKLGLSIEQRHNLAPVAARILSYLILNGEVGATFDELVCSVQASKSTVSNHLNHLLDLKKITYFTKPGDRKKYFVVNHDMIYQNMLEVYEMWGRQRELHLEVMAFKNRINQLHEEQGKAPLSTVFNEDYVQYLDVAMSALAQLVEKIKER